VHDKRFHAMRQVAPAEHHAPVAGLALKSNVCTEAEDLPLKSAAWMSFSQSHHVTDLEIRHHG
jgi:hypothetical protein